MKRIASALVAAVCLAHSSLASAQRGTAPDTLYIVNVYDADHDANADLANAIRRATTERRRILLIVGGNWCAWCHILDRYLSENADVHDAFSESFIVLKINVEPGNENERFLTRYPSALGYPDFLILESDGRFLAQQETSSLERGRGYDRNRMLAFAHRWRRGS